MANRFTKFNSNYLMRSHHQYTDLGRVMERDWVTTNGLNVLRFGSGRRIWYNSGNFVFTTSDIPTYHKKHNLSIETKSWTWDDASTADGTTNTVAPFLNTNDIRDYAYYGSAVELIRATIEDIISDFPGRMVSTNSSYRALDGTLLTNLIKNPFNIDLHHKNVTLGDYDSPMRFMSHSWKDYCVIDNRYGDEMNKINSYSIINVDQKVDCAKDLEGKVIKKIIITTDKGTYEIDAHFSNNNIVYVCKDASNYTFIIQPKQEYIDEYFRKLYGFKKQLLRQDTKPYYTNRFITPIEDNFRMFYVEQQYTWPSDDYCIDIESMSFSDFVSRLYDMAQSFDDMWSDNLYRLMTHEAIKNFDWTYSREYVDGDAQDNIDGGERMQKIIRVMGRVFDDVKVYIDSVKNVYKTTYDKIKNGPEALLSDLNDIKGVDVLSTIGKDYDIDAYVTPELLSKTVTKDDKFDTGIVKLDDKSELRKWYPTRHSEDIYPDINDNEFMRRLTLTAKQIMRTKGTQHSIEMILGLFGLGRGVDYDIEEKAYYIDENRLIKGDECIKDRIEKIKKEEWDYKDLINWNEIESKTMDELANEINAYKDADKLYYNDPFSGVPLRSVYLERFISKDIQPYVIPYYDTTQLYDGDIIFQGKGGWGKFIKNEGEDDDHLDDMFDYQETLSYLHVAGQIGDILSINPYELEQNVIYFVVNLGDYTEYDEYPPMDIDNDLTMSHFFILVNASEPHKLSSWKNIVVKTTLDENGGLQMVEETAFNDVFGNDWKYNPTDEDITDADKLSAYKYAFAKMKYLDGIISTNIANNPHVGYGNYDDGKTFIEYMKLPFKYSLDKSLFDDERGYYYLALLFNYGKIEDNTINDKIQIMNTRQGGNKTDFFIYDTDEETITKEYTVKEDSNNTAKRWYINSKELTITYKNPYNQYFSNYFKTIIMPYLMQVIPSTTILKLKNFTK